MKRCWWCGTDPLYVRYHDEEWGKPVRDDRRLFEKICLEGFQAGLSWLTILRKRENFRRAFEGFDPAVVSRYGPAERERLMSDASIVRNGAKIDATVGNAVALLAISAEAGSFAAYLAGMMPGPARPLPPGAQAGDIPSSTPVSDALSRDLKRRGFRFVGTTIMYAFMQSVGLVDDHLPGCFRYRGEA